MKAKFILLGALLLSTGSMGLMAAQNAPAPEPNWLDKIKKPVPWLTWGGDLRFRNEYFDNGLTLNPNARLHEQDYFRFRGRLWTAITPVEDFSLNVRLTSEPRYWVKDAGYGAIRGRHGVDWQEGIIDNLYIKWANMFQQPLTLAVGRQDLRFGDGWLVMDGTPNDGSRTFFLDAARLTWDLKEHQTTVDMAYIEMSAWSDEWLPTVNHHHKALTDQDERGAILYIANKSVKELNVDAYFMYKKDHDIATAFGNRGDLYTPGLRLAGALGEHWAYRAEGALQWGRRQEPRLGPNKNNVMAYGFNSRLSYLFKDPMSNVVSFDYEYLSGDNPGTSRIESFDLLWARWPRWSELYIYDYAAEWRIAQLGNLHRFGPGWTFKPIKGMDMILNYNLLYADRPAPALSAAPVFTRNGHFRGHYLQAIVKHQFNKHISAHIWGEVIFPGNFYTFQQPHTWLRTELMFNF